jgi:cellulose synthase/poly-beta-1,6-N-acetylglucosamine synthase-like glycosyltransferase
LGDNFDAVVVLDADNHMRPDFLLRMNEAMGKGFQALQGCRAAKNTDSSMSVLDGVSEAVNNHLLCSGHRAIGLSARLAGSGMAFDYSIFKKVMSTVDALGGFDKELELKLTQMGVTIGYAPEAIVMDEKVNNTNSYSRQRGRWLAAQYRYGRRFAKPAVKALFTKGQVDFFNKTLQMALPPRLVLPGVLAFGTVVSALFGQHLSLVWSALLAGNLLSFALAIPRSHWNSDFFKALLQLPKAFAATLKALTLMPLAAKQFLHTPHGSVVSQA